MSMQHGKHRAPAHPLRRLAVLLLGVVLASAFAMPSASAAPTRHHPHHGGGLLANTCADHLLQDIATSEATHALYVNALVAQGVEREVAEVAVSAYEFDQDRKTLVAHNRAGETAQTFAIDVGRLAVDLLSQLPGGDAAGVITNALLPCVEWAFNLDRQAAQDVANHLRELAGLPPIDFGNNSDTGGDNTPPPPPSDNPPPDNGGGGQTCSGGTAFLQNGVCVGFDPSNQPEGSPCTGVGPDGPNMQGVVRNGVCNTVGTAL
jgi:hypothetical protein